MHILWFCFFLEKNTTQVYYFNLQIESSAFDNFTWLLGNITEFKVDKAKLTNITITTGN